MNKVSIILKGSRSKQDAMKALEVGGPDVSDKFLRPLLVDWNNGRAGEFARHCLAWLGMC